MQALLSPLCTPFDALDLWDPEQGLGYLAARFPG